MILFVTSCVAVFIDFASAECTDIYGRSITPNTHFIPGPDICQLCVCDNTSPKWCKRVLCSPPQNCKSFVMGSSCCDYSCLDNTLSNGEYREEVDRRFIFSIIGAVFTLTILLFMVTRFRTRVAARRLLQHQQLAEDGRNLGSIGFITGSIGYLNLPNGHHFDEHPLVHFPLYKPNGHYFPRGEAPPPYDEAVADTPLNVAYSSQFLMNDRNSDESGVQRRRSNSEGLANVVGRSRTTPIETCICDSRQSSENVPSVAVNANLNSSSQQHRSIPTTVCANLSSSDEQSENKKLHQPIKRICQVHKKSSNTNKNEFIGCRKSNCPKNVKSISNSTTNTEPSQINSEILYKNISSFQHRTLPLSASLSSPLPSTSDSFDRQSQFATFSSVVNISSSDGDEPPSVINDPPAKYSDTDHVEEPTSQLMDDYHAECENCNLNVNAECDGTDEYFSEQETMTLQRKLHDASTIKCSEQSMKVSLTLPTNSRTRRCSSKSQKSGRWNSKDSPYKNKLEYVSSEDENNETESSQVASKSNEQNI